MRTHEDGDSRGRGLRRSWKSLTACLATGLLVLTGAGIAHADTLPSGADATGLTGERTSATRIGFSVSDKTTATVDVGTGNLNLKSSFFNLPGVLASEPLTLAYNSRSTASQNFMYNATSPSWTYGFNGAGSLSVQSNGTTVNYTSADGAVWPFTRPSGQTMYTSPSGLKAVLTKLSPAGWKLYFLETSQVMKFDDLGRPTSVADRNGNAFSVDWSSGTSMTSSAGTTDARTVYSTYDGPQSEFHLFQKVNENPTRDYTVKANASGQIQQWRDPDGNWTYAGYNSSGLVTSFYNQNSKLELDFTYDSSRRVTSVTQSDFGGGGTATATTRFSYVSSAQTQVARPETSQSLSVASAPHLTYTLDSNKLVTQAVDEQGRVRATTFNGNLDTTSSTIGSGSAASTTTNTYDSTVNGGMSLTKSASQSGADSQAFYANTGQATQYLPSSSTDAAGNVSNYTYNGAGNQMTGNTGAVAANAEVWRNSDGTIASAVLPGNRSTNNKTTYTYNSTTHQLSGVTPVTGTSLGSKAYTYDSYGRLKTATDGAGHTTTYAYDGEDRLLTTSFSDSTSAVTNTYDGAGNLLTQASGGGTITNTYDAFNRLKTTANTAGGGTLTYGYNKNGAQTSLADSRGTTTQTYDTSGVLTKTTYPKGTGTASTVFVTNANGQRTDTFLSSNTSHTTWSASVHTEYDASGRVNRVTSKTGPASSPTIVSDMRYCYNLDGNNGVCGSVGSDDQAKLVWTQNLLNGQWTTFRYDASGRLISADETGANTYNYTYNDNGDRTSSVSTGSKPVNQTLTYNAADQITSPGYSYDGAGNLTASPGRTYTYNAAQQMTSATVGGNTYTYTYAGASQRALLSQSGPGTDYKMVYGATDAVGNPTIAQYKLGTYTAYVESDPLTGQPNMLRSSTDVAMLYVFDGTGSPIGLLADAGTSTGQFKYDPYGLDSITQDDGGNGVGQNPYNFKSGIYDRATGLVKFGFRWYNATTGAWTQQDTFDTPLDPANANRYAYAGNDPVNNFDPLGLLARAQAEFAGSVVAAFIGVVGVGFALATGGAAAIAIGLVYAAIGGFTGGGVTGYLLNESIPEKKRRALYGVITGVLQELGAPRS